MESSPTTGGDSRVPRALVPRALESEAANAVSAAAEALLPVFRARSNLEWPMRCGSQRRRRCVSRRCPSAGPSQPPDPRPGVSHGDPHRLGDRLFAGHRGASDSRLRQSYSARARIWSGRCGAGRSGGAVASRADARPLGRHNPPIPDRVCPTGILIGLATGCSRSPRSVRWAVRCRGSMASGMCPVADSRTARWWPTELPAGGQ